MAKNIQIKMQGSGTKKEIVEALESLLKSIKNESVENLSNGKTFEDHTLCTTTR